MVDAGEIFHPLRWSPRGGFQFLGDVPQLERAGVVVRMPATWRTGRPSRPQVTATVGTKAATSLGQDALLDFRMEVTLDGESLSAREVKDDPGQRNGLALIRGQWVEVDSERLKRTMAQFKEAERLAAKDGLTFAEAMRMLAGADVTKDLAAEPHGSRLVARRRGAVAGRDAQGAALARGLAKIDPGARTARHAPSLPASRRALAAPAFATRARRVPGRRHGPRQDHPGPVAAVGVARRANGKRQPSLLVAPASLLANWASEIERFAPGLKA
jgi:hypothetical protein